MVYYNPGLDDNNKVIDQGAETLSTLMGYFEYNRKFVTSRYVLYQDFPLKHVWKTNEGWSLQQRGMSVGCMYNCNPTAGERFYLRLLLTAVPGARLFTDLFYFEGVRYPTYHKACVARGLAEDDAEWYRCFDETVLFSLGGGLQFLFLTGICQQSIVNPQAIWDKYKDKMCDDLKYKLQQRGIDFLLSIVDPHFDYSLYLLQEGLTDLEKQLAEFGLSNFVFD
jgi:hypothetical protein